MKKTAVVIGQRRSGTSMMAGFLYHLGVPMGDEATPEQTSERNPKGFFEDREIVKLSEEVLHAIDRGEVTSMARVEERFGDRAKEIIQKRSKDNEVWGYKDVNQLLVHFLFKKYIKNPHYIIMFRNLLDSSLSLNDWHGKQTGATLIDALSDTAKNHGVILSFIQETTKDPMLFISYERAKQNPEKTVDDVIEFLKLEPTPQQRQAAINHCDKELTTIQQ